MSLIAAIKLINTLSKDEKRKFKLSTKKQTGKKDYLTLFKLICDANSDDRNTIKEKFHKLSSKASIDTAATYLIKIITDGLVESKIKDDGIFYLYHGYLKIQLLYVRSLKDEAYKELKRLQQLSLKAQNHLLQYLFYRTELNYLSDLDFNELSEAKLIAMQMKAREILKNIQQSQEHQSLYEILKFRLAHSGKMLSEDKKKDLNDLILSEMALVTGRIKYNFESKKLHLLFQSFFFTAIKDYKSALKTFNLLNNLFEENRGIWNVPPLDYFSSLDGILDSLRAIKSYKEMEFYINKMDQLDIKNYPEFFRRRIRKSVMLYQLCIFIGLKKYDSGIDLVNRSNRQLLYSFNLVNDEKQKELLFYLGLLFFSLKNYRKAQKYLNQIVLVQKANYHSLVFKAARLLSILALYEENNMDYLDYEIRSYKRPYQKLKLLKTEVLLFKLIKLNPNKNSFIKNKLLWPKISSDFFSIEKDQNEMQLMKYFDFMAWIKEKFNIT